MGLIKEPVEINFTVESKVWTAEEEKEFSELIRKQKAMRNKRQLRRTGKLIATQQYYV